MMETMEQLIRYFNFIQFNPSVSYYMYEVTHSGINLTNNSTSNDSMPKSTKSIMTQSLCKYISNLTPINTPR